MKKTLLISFALIMIFVLAACGGKSNGGQEPNSSGSPANTNTTTPDPAVKRTNKLVLYTPASEELIEMIIPAFEKEYDVKVEIVAAGTGELLTRIKSEANNPIADAMWGGSPSLIMPMAEHFETYISANDGLVPEIFRNKEGFITRYSSTAPVLLINTKLAGDIEINGYADLLNPALKGKISHGDSATSSSSYNHLENMLFAMGKDHDPFSDEAWAYVEKFVANLDGKIASSSGSVHKGVADGEFVVGLTYEEPAMTYMQNGADVKVVYMTEGTIFKESGNYIVKNAKNIENAKLFSDFLLSDYVQNMLGLETMNRPVRADAQIADFKTPLAEINTLAYDVVQGNEIKDDVVERYMDVLTK